MTSPTAYEGFLTDLRKAAELEDVVPSRRQTLVDFLVRRELNEPRGEQPDSQALPADGALRGETPLSGFEKENA